jgi:hypothetical protein
MAASDRLVEVDLIYRRLELALNDLRFLEKRLNQDGHSDLAKRAGATRVLTEKAMTDANGLWAAVVGRPRRQG